MKIAFCFFGWCCLISSPRVAAADELLYFPATVENTTLADGTALTLATGEPDKPEEITRGPDDPEPDNHWHWQEGFGSGAGAKRGVFTAAGQPGNNAPMLRTLVAGLKPMTCYQVHGFFWIAGTAGGKAEPHGDQCWDIRLGLSMASIRGFGYADRSGLPDTIGIDRNPPLVFRQLDAPLRSAAGEPKTDRQDDRCLFRVALGVAKTDAKGTLVAYIDDQANDTNHGRTCYDGIGVIAAPGAAADVGNNVPGALHLAARTGDLEMMRRELAAGADPNTLDTDFLTPLYYLCAAGEHERVAALLQAGAKPDVSGQKFPPLAAAAYAGDAPLTKTLLEAGAKIDNSVEPQSRTQRFRFNPVEAAVTSGSVEVLKLMMARKPDLDLEHTVYGKIFDSKNPNEFSRLSNGLVKSSLEAGNAEMAAFLINRGCWIQFTEASHTPSWRFGRGSQTLMLKAVMNHPPMLGVVDALTKRGVPLILTREPEYTIVVVPWDALSGAVWEGQTTLVSQWLPMAAEVNENYRIRLTVLAESCGNPEVLAMVNRQFPNVTLPPYPYPYDPVEVSRAKTSGPKDRFQARTLARQAPGKSNGKKVLAVISSSAASGPAAALAAKASELPAWTVVEREEIHKLLTEKSLADPATVGTTELSAIGDRLSADIFIIVSKFGSGSTEMLQFEAANVRTGLLFDRLIVAAKEFNSDTFCDNYLARLSGKLDAQNGAAAPVGITLLDIAADPKVPDGRTLASVLHAGMLQEIDSIPGLIALTREQMEPIASEKVLKQTGALWGAAWTLEGGLRQADGGQVELALRLRSLGSPSISHDVRVSGDPVHPQLMVKETWRQLAVLIDKTVASDKDTDPQQRAATEANRLLRETEWLKAVGRPWEAVPAIDAALYLGADPMKALRLRMRIHWDARHFWNPLEQFGTAFNAHTAWRYPLWPEYHDYARRWVGEYLELLRLTSETLDRTLLILKAHPNPKESFEDFWRAMDDLVNCRSNLVPDHLNPEQLAILREFDAELEPLVKRMLSRLPLSPHNLADKFWDYERNTRHFRTLPWLGEFMAEQVIRIWSAESVDGMALFEFLRESEFDRVRPDVICDLLEHAMTGENLRFANLRHAELEFIRTTGEPRHAAAKNLARVLSDSMASSLIPPTRWVTDRQIAAWIPMITGSSDRDDIPWHGRFLGTLVCSPQQVPDQLFRMAFYYRYRKHLYYACDRNSREWKLCDNSNADSFNSELRDLRGRNASGDDFDRLSGTVHLLDATYGTNHAASIQPRIDACRPKMAGRYFGSKGKFPILDFEGTLDTRLLTDVRNGITESPAWITQTLVDPKNRDILWLVLQPYQDWDFKLVEPRPADNTNPNFSGLQPWLVAVDCRDGHTLHKINLATIPGLWSNGTPQSMRLYGFDNATHRALLATANLLLIQIRWGIVSEVPGQPDPDMTSLVVINRTTGETRVLPQHLRIEESVMIKPRFPTQDLVAAIGDSIFVVQATDRDKGANMLWQINPGEKPIALTKSGRRPEESPFDAEDRRIGMLHVDEGRLLVTSSWGHFAYYNPVLAKWEDAPALTEAEWRNRLQAMERKILRPRPMHHYTYEDGIPGTISDYCDPGRLTFHDGNGPWYYLPVRMTAPDNYRARFQLASDLGLHQSLDGEYEWIAISDLTRSNLMAPAFLNQTDKNFILTLGPVNDGTLAHTDKATPSLPFLWTLDKKEAFAAMKKIQGK